MPTVTKRCVLQPCHVVVFAYLPRKLFGVTDSSIGLPSFSRITWTRKTAAFGALSDNLCYNLFVNFRQKGRAKAGPRSNK